MLDKAKELYKLKRQADEMRRRMEAITVAVNHRGVEVTMRGDQRVEAVVIDGEEDPRVKEAFNRAVKESQKKVAKKLRGQLSELGLPGF